MCLFLAIQTSFYCLYSKKKSKSSNPHQSTTLDLLGCPQHPQTPSLIEWPSPIKWLPAIELVSPTTNNLTENPA